MTPASDTALEFLHTRATEFFTGALEACNIESAFDRRIRFEGNTLRRLIPDGSGPDIINLSQFKRIFVIAIGKAAGPMLEILLDRMKRRQGLRGICCTKYLPKKRNWRFRYFEGGHPLPNEDSFAAARAALAMLKKAKKDTLVFFLISGGGSAMFDLPLDPADRPRRHHGIPRSAARLRRAHQRDQYAAQAFQRRERRPPRHGRARGHEGVVPVARCSAAHPRCALIRTHFARPLHRRRSPRDPREIRSRPQVSSIRTRLLRARGPPRVARQQELASTLSCPVSKNRTGAGAPLHLRGQPDRRRRSLSRFGL